ncbi:hypothetical protein [Mycolicibacterium llatzerense]|uniref:hypothetical protein n=1 Tax=Mycolicibacterium llatzerense TaxID=280871 RepID=UPI0031D3CAFF
MGKRARLDRRSKRQIKVDDAADLIAGVRFWADGGGTRGQEGDWAREVAGAMMPRWEASEVVLRVDPDFGAALVDSHTDVALVPDWLDRFPFNAVAYSLAEPLSLHDGTQMCRYFGMLATGVRAVAVPQSRELGKQVRNEAAELGTGPGGFQHTYYVNIPGSDGVRCLWLFKLDGDPRPRVQSVSFQLRGELADQETTLAELIDTCIGMATDQEQSQGLELPTLITLSMSLLLYTATTEPDLEWPPAEHIARPHQLKTSQIGNLGWRTGAALRQSPIADGRGKNSAPGSASGRHLSAHIRKAHWHRVRMAERDELGRVCGNLHGTQGTDWHYELRWYPPTTVNAEHRANPTVRDL